MNHDPGTIQIVHNVALGHHDDIGKNRRRHTSSKHEVCTTFCFSPIYSFCTCFRHVDTIKLMNHDPGTLQMVHNVALGHHDDIGMNQKKAYII